MRIGILVSMINNFGEKGFYNSQEIGLGKLLAKKGNEVVVYKLLKEGCELPSNYKENSLTVLYSHVNSIGINGLVRTSILDKSLDGLVFFSDTQLAVPCVDKWCKKNRVIFVPYIGVIESHSDNRIKALIMNTLFKRNLRVFKQNICIVKNSDVQERLSRRGVSNIQIAPVGIDLDLLKHDFERINKEQLKKEYGLDTADRVILFVGRLEEEKRPLDLLEYFHTLCKEDHRYKLFVVGKGVLCEEMHRRVKEYGISENFRYFEKVPNCRIWELYHICDCFLNLNKQEIFGMVLLEAMFYKTKVIAWHAPGPDYIIEDGISGYLVSSEQELYQAIEADTLAVAENAHSRIVNDMTWEKTAKIICDIIKTKKRA